MDLHRLKRFGNSRYCLISLGKELFFQVLEDPDTLADIVDRPDIPYMQAEGFQYPATQVYKEKTGEEMPQGRAYRPAKPTGTRIDHDDEEVMRRHFPKIVARFPQMGD